MFSALTVKTSKSKLPTVAVQTDPAEVVVDAVSAVVTDVEAAVDMAVAVTDAEAAVDTEVTDVEVVVVVRPSSECYLCIILLNY